MGKTEKVAVTIAAEVLSATERLRKVTGESRSAVVTRALRLLLTDRAKREKTAQYVEAYRQMPETDDEVEAARAIARASLKSLPW